MCSVWPPSVNGTLTENADWPGFGDWRTTMNEPTLDRAVSIAAFIRGSSAGTSVTLSVESLFEQPVTARASTIATAKVRLMTVLRLSPNNVYLTCTLDSIDDVPS